jgi:GntR family transcriptional regulator
MTTKKVIKFRPPAGDAAKVKGPRTPVPGTPGPKPGGPRYQQIADELLAQIRNGTHTLGAMLPPEIELSDRYRVSRFTVREALRQLETLGLVTRRQGSGTLVIARQPLERFTQEISSIGELLQYPANTRLFVLRTVAFQTSEALSRVLGSPAGDPWVRIEGVRRVRTTSAPICTSTVFVRPEYADVVDLIGTSAEPVSALIEQRFGVRVARVDIDVEATLASPEQSSLLEVERGTPALLITRRYWDTAGRLFEVSLSHHPAPRFTYRLTVRRAGGVVEGK